MNIIFRVDASLKLGAGHVMRCLTFARALREMGCTCQFICRNYPGNLIQKIRQQGFTVNVLLELGDYSICNRCSPDREIFNDHGGIDWKRDALETRNVINGEVVHWLIVDHYGLDINWERDLRQVCCNLMVIDDLANRKHECDIILDQNLGRKLDDYIDLVPKSCAILAGPSYALLNPEFLAHREASLHRRIKPVLKNVLISMGGVDKTNATGKLIRVLNQFELPEDMSFTVVMGLHALWMKEVRSLSKEFSRPIKVKCDVNNMVELMVDSDLAIGAAGITSWERCCLGLPSLIVTIAENQKENALALEKVGGAKLLGTIDDIQLSLKPIFNRLIKTPCSLSKLTQNSSSIVDGHGVHRVVQAIKGRNNYG